MPKYNDFELDLQKTEVNQPSTIDYKNTGYTICFADAYTKCICTPDMY